MLLALFRVQNLLSVKELCFKQSILLETASGIELWDDRVTGLTV